MNARNAVASSLVAWRAGIMRLVAASILALAGCSAGEPPTDGAAPQIRRLTEAQYRNIVADVFGTNIVVAGRFDPLVRVDGLLAVGASKAAITSSAFERYEAMAHNIAAQVVDASNRGFLIPCKPAAERAPDRNCARTYLTEVGRYLFRRPLTTRELRLHLDVADQVAAQLDDFYAGLAYSLAGMLTSPNFLFIADVTEPDPQNAGSSRLSAYSKASRLSFFLWNSTPDDLLLKAAEQGELHTQSGMVRQIERLMSSPRLETGMRAFFSDMLELERVDALAKDATIYPAFTVAVAAAAREQTLRTLVDHLLTRDEDYRDLFTSRKTFVTGPLGLVYRISVSEPDGWVPYEFSSADLRAGLHTQLSFLALHAHPGKSSPTLRGKAMRELLLCQKVPDPPGNVDFTMFLSATTADTARERLKAHNENAACAGCHRITDPIGLALETFDGAGQFRTMENKIRIDTSGELDGVDYADAAGLGKALHDHPAVPSCLLNRLYAYAAGRAPNRGEQAWMAYLGEQFDSDGYRVPQLFKRIALSEALYRVNVPVSATKEGATVSRGRAAEGARHGKEVG